ncbi:MAG: hypothetical protein KJO24_00765 [Gammaproteobacteria bacterium]|nr:hypothetical protein [Gammaproteobacteria bacterium]
MKFLTMSSAMLFATTSQAHTEYANQSALIHELMHALPLIVALPLAVWMINRVVRASAGRIKTKK